MTYCTSADYTDRYSEEELIQSTDRHGTGAVDSAVFDRAAADAAAEIDGYLAGRYPLPLASVPPILTALASDIVRYRLFPDIAPDAVRQRYEDARRLLESLASGRVTLGLPAATTPVAVGVATSAPAAVFSGLVGF